MESDKSTTLSELKDKVKDFIQERDWTKYHNPKDIAVSIAIEVGELLELFQWVKDDDQAKKIQDPSEYKKLEEELADIIIYCLSLANVTNMDISSAIVNKIEKNKAKYPVGQVKGDYKKYTELEET